MGTEIAVALIVLAGGALTTLVNYLLGRRKSSGSVSTSDAASLWAESNALRKEYKERAESLEEQLKVVNGKLQTVMEELTTLRANSKTMGEKIESLKKIIAELQEENKRLLSLRGAK